MFDWMNRKSGPTQAQLRVERPERLAKVLEVPDDQSFTSRASYQPRIGFATKPTVGADGGDTFQIRWNHTD